MTDYKIERADLEKDKEGILNVLSSNFSDFNLKRYEWLYIDNPCGKAHTFVARSSDSGKIIGCVSVFPRRMIVAGKRYLAGITGDFAVNKNIRGFLGFQLQRAITRHAGEEFDFLYSIPNPLSEGIMERIGYLKVEEITRIARIFKADEKLKTKVNPFLAKLGAPLVNLYLNKSLKKIKSLYKEKDFDDFDSVFDEFWGKLAHKTKLIGVRDSEFLHWKYFRSPYFKYRAYTLQEKNSGELLGYVIYHTDSGRCVIDDMQHICKSKFCTELISSFLWYLKHNNPVSTVSIFLSNPTLMNELVKTTGFYERDRDSKLIIFLNPARNELNETLQSPENWSIFKGDWDI